MEDNLPGHALSCSLIGEKYSVTENWFVGKTSFEIYLYSVGTIYIIRKAIISGLLSNIKKRRIQECVEYIPHSIKYTHKRERDDKPELVQAKKMSIRINLMFKIQSTSVCSKLSVFQESEHLRSSYQYITNIDKRRRPSIACHYAQRRLSVHYFLRKSIRWINYTICRKKMPPVFLFRHSIANRDSKLIIS